MVTVLLATCERYETTLPLCLMSIVNQTYKPSRIVLVDDSKQKRFYEYPVLKNILILMKLKGIEFDYYHGPCKGAANALQMGLENIKDGWVMKTDDDNILEANVLEIFVDHIKPEIGAMSGIILDKKLHDIYLDSPEKVPTEVNGVYNKIENIYSEFNIQMVHNQDPYVKRVEHIYSNYFFYRELADDYPIELTPSSHREETIFTYNIFRKGCDMIIIPAAKIYHIHYDSSGERMHNKSSFRNNELFFIEKLKEWGIVPDKLEIHDDGKQMYVVKKDAKYLVTLNL